ncbi:MAG: hypothetical protein PHF31_05340 [Methylobacter sp.]|nr:hypothetical protein [Methylobacter sp.]
MNSKLLKLLNFALLLLPATAFAGEVSEVLSAPKSLNLTHHIVGYLSIAVTVLAYSARQDFSRKLKWDPSDFSSEK